jgi:hypothetical protein
LDNGDESILKNDEYKMMWNMDLTMPS